MKQNFKLFLRGLLSGVLLWKMLLYGLVGLMVWSYYSVNFGDSPLLGIDTTKRFAVEEVFEKEVKQNKCLS